MDYNALAELLYSGNGNSCDYYENMYPERNLPDGAMVTRFAPSPTGYLHLGGVFQVLVDERLARQSGGIFMLRIEDTDNKREIEGGIEAILDGIASIGVSADEGVGYKGDSGAYGPYRQSRRTEIYRTFAKRLVADGKAYPCFCSEERLAEMRSIQEAAKENLGYYGKYAACRNLTLQQVKEHIDAGDSFVLRFRADPEGKREEFVDCVRGKLEFPANDMDMIILKSDGVPVYHFAHVVDDHLMRTTHVVRGEEWLATLPFHVQLFDAFGWKRPQYIHTATIMKSDNGGKRKLSKRKDPEAAVEYFLREGYPREALIDYLMMLLNSNFEEWRMENPDASYREFLFSTEKMSHSGALFDMTKLYDICKNMMSRMTAEKIYEDAAAWSEKYDPDFNRIFTLDRQRSVDIMSIGRGGEKPRKDIGLFSEIPAYTAFFFDEIFEPDYAGLSQIPGEDAAQVLERYRDIYDPSDDQTEWFSKIRELAVSMGYAPDTKTYKKNREIYKGHSGDISMILRVAVTGRQNSPDLYQVMKILGTDKIYARLSAAKENII